MAPARGSAPRPIKVFPFQIAGRSSGYPSGIPNISGKRRQCLSSSEHNADNRRARQLASGAGSLEPPVLPRVESIAPGGSWRQTGRKWRPQRSAPKLGPFLIQKPASGGSNASLAGSRHQPNRKASPSRRRRRHRAKVDKPDRSIDWNGGTPHPHHQTRSPAPPRGCSGVDWIIQSNDLVGSL